MGSPPRQLDGAIGPVIASSSGCASPYEIGSTGILVMVGASARDRRAAPGTAATPGVSGSPGNCSMSATLPRCTPSLLRIGPAGNTGASLYPSSAGSE